MKKQKSINNKNKPSIKKGLPPGSLIYIGTNPLDVPKIKLVQFNFNTFEEKVINLQIESIPDPEKDVINWYQLFGINNPDFIKSIGNTFKLDNLVLEDILNTHHRTKLEVYEHYIFLVLKTIKFNNVSCEIVKSHLCIICKDDSLITFQENNHSFFSPIINRIKMGKGKIKTKNYDYLAYTIIDMVVDSYIETIEELNDSLEEIEFEINNEPNQKLLIRLEQNRKTILNIRKLIIPLREITSEILRDDNDFIEKTNEKYFRDVYDHTLHLIESVDNLIEMNNSIKDLYHSTISFKLNQIMQILTIYTVIFTPITFIAGLYGMNFINMPELKYKYGYFIILVAMLLIVSGMFIYFKRKKWL
ncbi:MAG: magnesium/cobalt transporter CorA [Marinilabiliaceae bacterium]|nr:magnesium/cobalt transporter CorA [Marinilabiliaceae bacterium]